MEQIQRYTGIGKFYLNFGNGFILNKEVEYDIYVPWWSSGGFSIKFRSELTNQERERLGLDLQENEIEFGDGLLDEIWSISDLNNNIIISSDIILNDDM